MNQVELEQQYHRAGIDRARAMMERNEQEGNATANPYATPIMRQYVLPLADLIVQAKDAAMGGSMPVAVGLVLGIDEAAVAYIAIRSTITYLMQEGDRANKLALDIGADVYRECVLSLFANQHPENYARINMDLQRKASKNPRHRSYVMRRAAASEGMEIPEWHETDKGHVGYWMLQLMGDLGLIETHIELDKAKTKGGLRKSIRTVTFTEQALDRIDSIRERCVELMPIKFPFVERPKDWTSMTDGGFHTAESRALMPTAVKMPYHGAGKRLAQYKDEDTASLRAAMNILQGTRWAINTEILDILPRVAKALDAKELTANPELPAPERPDFLDIKTNDELTDEEQELFSRWKRAMAEWHTNNRLRRTSWSRYSTALRVAREFSAQPVLHFLYQADNRGRLYAQTSGISPQGSDMQKALLRFAVGKPLGDGDGKDWFFIDGANRFGVDKVPFPERIQWVKNNAGMIRACAQDPIANKEWLDADSPLMFLAWALEFNRWSEAPDTFLNYQPVGQDGSCNGLQHYSAMLRDPVGGKAVNLIPSTKPSDIYAQVAVVTQRLLEASEPSELRDLWLGHGITRKLVKRSVMTLPYGSTRHSCKDFILDDYLFAGAAPDLPKKLYVKLAQYLSGLVWQAIGEVVIAAVAGMSWLQKASASILKTEADQISWITPSGFKVIQSYFETKEIDIRSKLYAGSGVRVYIHTGKADRNRHKNGIAPNFIHALDASHLTLTTIAAKAEGIDDLAMIHDSYGTHACDSGKLARIIREQFVWIYTHSHPLKAFHARYPHLPVPPAEGTLDVQLVLQSPYFFA